MLRLSLGPRWKLKPGSGRNADLCAMHTIYNSASWKPGRSSAATDTGGGRGEEVAFRSFRRQQIKALASFFIFCAHPLRSPSFYALQSSASPRGKKRDACGEFARELIDSGQQPTDLSIPSPVGCWFCRLAVD